MMVQTREGKTLQVIGRLSDGLHVTVTDGESHSICKLLYNIHGEDVGFIYMEERIYYNGKQPKVYSRGSE